jgi:hypothetical protein
MMSQHLVNQGVQRNRMPASACEVNVGGQQSVQALRPTAIRRKAMNAIKGTVKNGKIVLDAPDDWPEGCRVIVEPVSAVGEKIGLDECEWRDDAASLADWEAWIKTIEPIELTPQEQVANTRFEEEFRRFNIEAVRKQMAEGGGE